MGLAVCVGMLAELLEDDPEGAEAFEEDLAEANRVLAAAGLPRHAEPRGPLELDSRASIDGFPYSFIHYLRRAYAHRVLSPDWVATPLPDDADPTADPKIQALLDGSESHLLCHSDAEGFYVPVDFKDVLFDEEDGGESGPPRRHARLVLPAARGTRVRGPRPRHPAHGRHALGRGGGTHRCADRGRRRPVP